jgi:hypothetical protein
MAMLKRLLISMALAVLVMALGYLLPVGVSAPKTTARAEAGHAVHSPMKANGDCSEQRCHRDPHNATHLEQ